MKNNKLLYALNAVLFIGLIVLYVLHFTSTDNKKMQNIEATAPITKEGGLTMAYVDTDTLLAKYQYAIDLQEKLVAYKNQQEHLYKQKMQKFQDDYQNYLKNGDKLTLSKQHETEASLKKRAEELSTLEQELVSKIADRQLEENTKMLNAIFAFVSEYNAANQQFDIVMRKTFDSSPTLFINPAMDITNEIIDGLNKEYAEVKSKKQD
ncbi:MAG: OmpH family outer membrane protein [Bacteroidales bacterium]|nr:OmpH family outer membrane protein [Bacteroidales bacterium]